MNFSQEFIDSNKYTIIELLNKISRPSADVSRLISKLETSDFFNAPASARFHNAVIGGLADHSLNVYYNLKSLVTNKHLEDEIPEESIIICGLLHDMSKINTYVPSIRNKKVYSENGSKWDNLGRFDWIAEESWAKKPERELFQYGNHEETSEYMIRQFIPLTLEESIAILHHHAGKAYDASSQNRSYLFNTHPLAVLLHLADMLSAFVDEEM